MNRSLRNKSATQKATGRRNSKPSSGGIYFELTVFTIATGKYLDYFNLQLPSLEKFLLPGLRVQIIVCTDRPQSEVATHSDRFEIKVSPIEPLPWPEVTLMRYREIWLRRDEIKSRNFLWLDADMRLEKTIFPQMTSRFERSIYLAKHPGFLFPQGKRMLTTHSLSVLLERLAYRLKQGHALGAWETNSNSQAFVPPRKRRRYVHGAVWGGDVRAVMEMVNVLMSRTNEDYMRGVVALWHDESHLNWFAANFSPKYFPRHFSAWPSAWGYNKHLSYFLSLDKGELDAYLSER